MRLNPGSNPVFWRGNPPCRAFKSSWRVDYFQVHWDVTLGWNADTSVERNSAVSQKQQRIKIKAMLSFLFYYSFLLFAVQTRKLFIKRKYWHLIYVLNSSCHLTPTAGDFVKCGWVLCKLLMPGFNWQGPLFKTLHVFPNDASSANHLCHSVLPGFWMWYWDQWFWCRLLPQHFRQLHNYE